jgi:hypothetical protein
MTPDGVGRLTGAGRPHTGGAQRPEIQKIALARRQIELAMLVFRHWSSGLDGGRNPADRSNGSIK